MILCNFHWNLGFPAQLSYEFINAWYGAGFELVTSNCPGANHHLRRCYWRHFFSDGLENGEELMWVVSTDDFVERKW